MPLIELVGASVSLRGRAILHDLDWKLESGAHFAVLGGNGAGKSTFLRLLAGQLWPRPHHARLYGFGAAPTWSPLRAREQIALLSPEIQERFVRQSQDGADGERGWQLEARTAILAGFFGSELLHQTPDAAQEKRADELIGELKLERIAHRPLQTLSQGQLRRVLLARSLVSRPRLLLLDEACAGLDAASRAEMLETINAIARSGETTLGFSTHRREEIVSSIGHLVTLQNGRLVAPAAPKATREDEVFAAQPATRFAPDQFAPETLIRLQNVSVWLDGQPILRDLNWHLQRGQHVALEGGNGAGKTTFLRLLRGELWPAHGGIIERFGATRPLSRAALGAKISLLSPALQARYSDDVSVAAAVESGHFDSLGSVGSLSSEQTAQTRAIIEKLGLGSWLGRSFSRLSYGQRRRVLLARALVTRPQILLLDEALDGLDSASRGQWHALLEGEAARGTTFVVTSHHRSDYPPFLTHAVRLEAGRIVAQTPIL